MIKVEKENLMIIKRLFTLLTLLVMAFSCKPADDAVKEEPELVLLSEGNMSVSPDGGTQKISIQINNPVDGGELRASSKAAWIEDIAVISGAEVSFNVMKNEDRSPRSATIKVSYIYPDGADFINVELTQGGIDGGSVSISVQNVDYQAADITVEPSDDKFLYVVRVVPESEFDSSIDDISRFEKEMEYFREYAESGGMSLITALEKNGGYGKKTFKKKGLKIGTSYRVYSYGVSSELELITDFAIEQFETRNVEMTDFSIAAELNVNALSVNVKVSPDDDNKYYYMSVVTKKHLERYGDNISEMVNAWVLDLRQSHIDMGNTASDFLENRCFKGPQEYINNMLATGTDYCFVAIGLNDDAIPDSPVCYEEFETGVPGNPADLTVDFEVHDIGPYGAIVDAKPSDKMVLYVWDLAQDGFTPEEQMEYFKDMAEYSGLSLADYLLRHSVRGDDSYPYIPLEPEKTYTLYYIGLNSDGSPATDVVFNGEFTTLKEEGNQ